uniref:tetratricopeptide repeat protein n=1 Tax=Rhodoferax sp. GW822-FHT02A01 TaxID=3141537 RepID=UPI00406C8621
MPTHPDAGGKLPRGAVIWLGLLVVLIYASSQGGVFQFDDYNVIVDQPAIHSGSAWLADWGEGIRPLLKLSYLLNWTSGWGTVGFHLVNILIHFGAVLLVYRLSHILLLAKGMADQLPYAPWLAAALFALHPAHTEAVTYICGRSSSLMALLFLAGVWSHATAVSMHSTALRKLLPPLFMVLALSVKETAMTFPLALLLWDTFSGMGIKAALRKAWRSWAVLLLAAFFFLLNTAYREAMWRSLEFNSLPGNLATQLTALLYLARQWAVPLWLNIDPDLPVQHDFAHALPGLALLLASFAVLLYGWHSRSIPAFAVAWALLDWMPLYLFLPRLDVANDRQLYLATWPLGLALVVELQSRLSQRIAMGVAAALLLAGAVLTVQRNQDYRSEIALWEQTVALSPGKSRAHNNLGYAYMEAGRTADARREYLQALRLDAGNVKARLNLRRMNAASASH